MTIDFITQEKDYWVASNAINITLNALSNPNRIQCSVSSGAVVRCFYEHIDEADSLGYTVAHDYHQWPISSSPTYFNSNTEKYVYIAIPRSAAVGVQAIVVFPSDKLDIYGRKAVKSTDPETGEETIVYEQIGSTDYFYVWLQATISAPLLIDGVLQRIWTTQIATGKLDTPQGDAERETDSEWYLWSAIGGFVTFLREIRMSVDSWFANIRLGKDKRELTGVATADTPDEFVDSETLVVTPSYLSNKFLRKDMDDSTPYSLGVGEDLTVGGDVDVTGQERVDVVQSHNYSGSGLADTGFLITNDNGSGDSLGVFDYLTVRKKMIINSLEIKETHFSAGDVAHTLASAEIARTDYFYVDEEGNRELLGYSTILVPWSLKGGLLALAKGNLKGIFGHYKKVRLTLTQSQLERCNRIRCYFLAKDGDREVENWFRANDLVLCQTWNVLKTQRETFIPNLEEHDGNVYWWRKVHDVSWNTGVTRYVAKDAEGNPTGSPTTNPANAYVNEGGVKRLYDNGIYHTKGTEGYDDHQPVTIDGNTYHWFDVAFGYDAERSGEANWCDMGSDLPAAGDKVVQFGNTTDPDRMNIFMIEVNGACNPDAPDWKMYRGVYTFNLTNCWWGGESCRKTKWSVATGIEAYAPQFNWITEYGIARQVFVRDEVYWNKIAFERDDDWSKAISSYPDYSDDIVDANGRFVSRADGSPKNYVRKCRYYEQVSHNGSAWLCSIVESFYWRSADGRKLPAKTDGAEYVRNYTYDEPSAESNNWTEQVEKGDPGAFKSTAFCLTNTDISSYKPQGGTSGSPWPTSTKNASGATVSGITWTDEIPSGTAKIWMTTAWFYSDGTHSEWTSPRNQRDTETLDVEFSPSPTQPDNPVGTAANKDTSSIKTQRHNQGGTNMGWFDPNDTLTGWTWSDMKWRAERKIKNGEYYGNWTISRIKGENAIRIDLSNDNDTMLYSSSKGLVSGSVTSVATLWDGSKDVSSQATWEKTANFGCEATFDATTRTITVIGMTALVGYVEIKATYTDKNKTTYTPTIRMRLKKLVDADKYDLEITPNSIAYNVTKDNPAESTLTIRVFKTSINSDGSVTREQTISLPTGYSVYAGSTKLTGNSSSNTYTHTTDNSAISEVQVKIATSADATDFLDCETIPVVKAEDGANGDTPMQAFQWNNSATSAPSPLPSGATLGNWSTNAPNRPSTAGDHYLWMTQTVKHVAKNGTVTYDNWSAAVRISGNKGDAGEDASDREFIYIRTNTYPFDGTQPKNVSRGKVHGTGDWVPKANQYTVDDYVPEGWSDTAIAIEEDNRYVYAAIRTKAAGHNQQWSDFTDAFLWSNWGHQGIDGDGVQYIYKLFDHELKDDERTSNIPTKPAEMTDGEWIPSGWSDDPLAPTAALPFCYCSVIKKIGGSWADHFEKLGLWSKWTKDADVWTIGNDGYWYKNGVKQSTKAEGTDGTGVEIKGTVATRSKLTIEDGKGYAVPMKSDGTEGTKVEAKHGDCYICDADRRLYMFTNTPSVAWNDLGEFKGEPGKSSYIHIAYAKKNPLNVTTSTVDSIGFTVNSDGSQYEWMGFCADDKEDDPGKYWNTLTPEQKVAAVNAYKWNYLKGKDGSGYEYIYLLTKEGFKPTIDESNGQGSQSDDEFYPSVGNYEEGDGKIYDNSRYWKDDPPADISETWPVLWWASRKKSDGVWQAFGSVDLHNRYSKDGTGISSITRTFAISAVGTTASETTEPAHQGSWTTSSPAVTEQYPYLWAKEVVRYTNNTSTTKYYCIGTRGDNGVDAQDFEWVYIRTKTNTAPVIINDSTYVDTNGHDYKVDDHLPQVSGNSNIENNQSRYQCTDDPKGVDETYKYEWEIKRTKGAVLADNSRAWNYYQGTMKLHNNFAESAFIIDLENDNDQFGTDSSSLVVEQQDRSTVVSLYDGATKQVLNADDAAEPGVSAVLKYIDDDTTVPTTVATVTCARDQYDTTVGHVKVTFLANVTFAKSGVYAYITARCAKGSKNATFTIRKLMSGQAGISPTIYQLAPTQKTFSFGRNASNVLTPNSRSVTINATKTVGNSTSAATAADGLTYKWAFDEDTATAAHTGLALGTTISVSNTDAASHYQVWVELSSGDKETLPIVKDGANGDTGAPGQNGIRLALDNEHEDFLYDGVTLVAPSGGATSPIRLYDGINPITDFTPSIDWNQTSGVANSTSGAYIASRVLYVKGLTAATAEVVVKTTYGAADYYTKFTANKTNQDKYDISVYPSAVAYNPDTYQTQSIQVSASGIGIGGTPLTAAECTISTTANSGKLRLFWAYVNANGTLSSKTRKLGTSFSLTANECASYVGLYIELRCYSNTSAADSSSDYRLCDYETVEIAKVENGASSLIVDLDNESDQFGTDSNDVVQGDAVRSTGVSLYYGSDPQEFLASGGLTAQLYYASDNDELHPITNGNIATVGVSYSGATGTVTVTVKDGATIADSGLFAKIVAKCAKDTTGKVAYFNLGKVKSGEPGKAPDICNLRPTSKSISFNKSELAGSTPKKLGCGYTLIKDSVTTNEETAESVVVNGVTYYIYWRYVGGTYARFTTSSVIWATGILPATSEKGVEFCLSSADTASGINTQNTLDTENVPVVKDGINGSATFHEIQSSQASVIVGAESTQAVINANFIFRLNTSGVYSAYSCYYAVYRRKGGAYTLKESSPAKATTGSYSETVSNYTTVDAWVVVMSDDVITSANSLPSSFLAKLEIPVEKQGARGDDGYTISVNPVGVTITQDSSGNFDVSSSVPAYVDVKITKGNDTATNLVSAVAIASNQCADDTTKPIVVATVPNNTIRLKVTGVGRDAAESKYTQGSVVLTVTADSKTFSITVPVAVNYLGTYIQAIFTDRKEEMASATKTLIDDEGRYTVDQQSYGSVTNAAGQSKQWIETVNTPAGTVAKYNTRISTAESNINRLEREYAVLQLTNVNNSFTRTVHFEKGDYILYVNGAADSPSGVYVARIGSSIEYEWTDGEDLEESFTISTAGNYTVVFTNDIETGGVICKEFYIKEAAVTSSEFIQTADSITAQVNSKVSQASFDIFSDSIQTTVKDISPSKNLLKGALSGKGWGTSPQGSFVPNQSLKSAILDADGYITKASTDTNTWLYRDGVALTNKYYTLSFYAKVTTEITYKVFYIYNSSAQEVVSSTISDVSSISTRRTVKFRPPVSGTFTISFNCTAIRNPQLEEGETATDFIADTTEISSGITQSASNIQLFVTQGLSNTGIDITNGTIKLQANKVTFCDANGGNTDKIWIDPTNGTLHAVNGHFSGEITATSGSITGQMNIASGGSIIVGKEDSYRIKIAQSSNRGYITMLDGNSNNIILINYDTGKNAGQIKVSEADAQHERNTFINPYSMESVYNYKNASGQWNGDYSHITTQVGRRMAETEYDDLYVSGGFGTRRHIKIGVGTTGSGSSEQSVVNLRAYDDNQESAWPRCLLDPNGANWMTKGHVHVMTMAELKVLLDNPDYTYSSHLANYAVLLTRIDGN